MQTSPSFCPQCNAPVAANARFCSNCGSTIEAGSSNPTVVSSGAEAYWQSPGILAVPPPPPDPYLSPAQQFPPCSQPELQTIPQASQNYSPPAYAVPAQDSSRSVLRQIGCGVFVVILLIVLACGGLAYGGYLLLRSVASSVPTSTGTGVQKSQNGTPAPVVITTTPINATITYASVDITIINAQQATSFADDPNASQPGVVRLNMKETNAVVDATGLNNHGSLNYDYTAAFHLLLPGGTAVAPTNTQVGSGPAQGATQLNWIDFPVPTNVKVNQLTLRLGTDAEAQMTIPLTGKADVSRYQPKKVSPNVQARYGEMIWTLTTATSQLSESGKQADQGKRFVVITLKIDNPGSSNVNAYPPDFIRLKAGDTTAPPIGNTTIPLGFAAGTTNATGSAAFLVPQDGTAFTLILLPNALTGATNQASINFQI
jgi:hypothetical protein